jgi:hypothetical protein
MMITTVSKKAPNFAPGGTVFHQGTMTTREMTEAAMAEAGHQLWPKISPKPVPIKPMDATSHNSPKARPAGLCRVIVDEKIHGLSV